MKRDLLTIPNVGKNTKEDLLKLGVTCVEEKDCEIKKYREDKCQLYVFRQAVYYAEHETHEQEKLKWWYWKDKEYPEDSISKGS